MRHVSIHSSDSLYLYRSPRNEILMEMVSTKELLFLSYTIANKHQHMTRPISPDEDGSGGMTSTRRKYSKSKAREVCAQMFLRILLCSLRAKGSIDIFTSHARRPLNVCLYSHHSPKSYKETKYFAAGFIYQSSKSYTASIVRCWSADSEHTSRITRPHRLVRVNSQRFAGRNIEVYNIGIHKGKLTQREKERERKTMKEQGFKRECTVEEVVGGIDPESIQNDFIPILTLSLRCTLFCLIKLHLTPQSLTSGQERPTSFVA